MQFIIRKARASDCAAMMLLIRALAIYEKAEQEVTVDLAHFTACGFGEKPVWWAFVAESEGQVIGMALYYLRYSTWKGAQMYLEDIVVQQEHRGKGIGSALMQALIQEGRERNFSAICWQVLDWNQSAIEFYKKLGAKFDDEWINCKLSISSVVG